MRRRGWIGVFVVAAGLAGLSACNESVPTCDEAVSATFDRCLRFPYGLPPYGPGDMYDDPAGALQYCEDTLAAAQAQGCEQAHARFRSCMGSPAQCDDGYLRETCDRQEAALHACLAGQTSFELNCENGKDDDGDGLTDCWDPDCVDAAACTCYYCLSYAQSAERDVDLLFVIDDSASMAGEQALLQAQFGALVWELRNLTGGLPDLHLGVTSTDLGAGNYGLTYCEHPGGDGGKLLTGNCTNPTGAPYIVDVAPRSCDITRDATGHCTDYDCTQANCAHEPSTSFVVDADTGCPRCRNYTGQDLEDVFGCMADLGVAGCGFEQPLEAMYQALNDNPANTGFVREDAYLGVVIISDEDDCSASDPGLFDPSATALDSPLGPLTSFRCFEFGVTCDENDRTVQGERQGCEPRDDVGAMLHPVSRYVSLLQALKDPQQLVVAAIAGPTGDWTNSVTVGRDDEGWPALEYSCETERGGAVPGIRLHAVVEAFNEEEDLFWAYSSVCSPTYTDALEGVGSRLRDALQEQCLPAPLRGCSDIGAEFGAPADECADNDVCRPECRVTDVFGRGTGLEQSYYVPPCLEVCADGPCAGNTDRSLAYAQGHPDERDADLPVAACWQIRYSELCPRSNYAELFVSRRADPPPRTFSHVGCIQIEQHEQLCNDGVDNDEDCLVDMDDPDCTTW